MRNIKKFFSKVESMLLKLCFISILLLIGLQFIISDDDMSVFFNDAHNANDLLFSNNYTNQKGVVVLKIVGDKKYEYLEVLVNGESIANFKESNEVSIDVNNNDLIEINGIMYQDKAKIKVVGVSKNVYQPKLNYLVETSQSIEILSRVIIK